jgi:hypothetical protein
MMEGLIKIAPKNIKEFNGRKTISFQIEGQANWYSFEAEEEILKTAIPLITKGSKVSFTPDNFNTCTDLQILQTAVTQNNNHQPSEKWKDELISFDKLLEAGHNRGIKSITTNLIQLDLEKKFALFKAVIILKDDSVFEGHGDASPINVGTLIAPHFIRMAETRAIARALRFATDNAKTCEVELNSGIDEDGFL